jgi:hypothetical protein
VLVFGDLRDELQEGVSRYSGGRLWGFAVFAGFRIAIGFRHKVLLYCY